MFKFRSGFPIHISLISQAINALRSPIRTYPFGEYSKRVVHFDGTKNIGSNERRKLLENLKTDEEILIICGELSSGIRKFALEAAEKGHKVQIISGPNVKATDEEIAELKSKGIIYFQANDRPTAHGVLAGENMYLEDPHEINDKYETAILVKNARNDVITSFKNHFKALKINAEEI